VLAALIAAVDLRETWLGVISLRFGPKPERA
jgi:hypothetical protein